METTYFGQDDKDPVSWEEKGMRVPREHRSNEQGLIMTRWFDYAKLHPTQATYLYASLYKKQVAEFYAAYVDERTVENCRAFFPDDIFLSRDLTSMWLARASADSVGVPYDFALRFHQARALDRTFKSFPRPNQLYGEAAEQDLAAAWEETKAVSIRYSRMPTYSASAHKGYHFQKAHATFVIDQIKKRCPPHENLLARMIKEDVLNARLLDGHFPTGVIEGAVAAAGKLVKTD